MAYVSNLLYFPCPLKVILCIFPYIDRSLLINYYLPQDFSSISINFRALLVFRCAAYDGFKNQYPKGLICGRHACRDDSWWWIVCHQYKTKAMVFGPHSGPLNIHLNGHPIETVSQYKYLGNISQRHQPWKAIYSETIPATFVTKPEKPCLD